MNNYYLIKLVLVYLQIFHKILFAQETINQFDGVWKSYQYGETLEIKGDSVSIYQQNNSKLLKRQFTKGIVRDNTLTMITRDSPFEGVTNYQLSVADNVLILLEDHANNVYHYHKVEKKDPVENYSTDPITTLSYFWKMHSERYPYFMERNIDCIQAKDKIDSLANMEMDQEELFNNLKMLVNFFVNDGHIWVARKNKEEFDFYTPLHKNPTKSIKPKKDLMFLIGEKYLDQHQYQTTANGKIIYKYLADNIGYIFIASFYNMSEKEDKTKQLDDLRHDLDSLYIYFRDARGLIVDVRYNGGGNDWAALNCSGLFLSKSRAVLSKRSRIQGTDKYGLPQTSTTSFLRNNLSKIPTVVLSGKFSVSATETFLIALKQGSNTFSMGEASRGMLSDSYVFELPNGWFFGVYSDKVYSYDGKIYENRGVPVDHEIHMKKTDYDKGIDTVLEAAISYLNK